MFHHRQWRNRGHYLLDQVKSYGKATRILTQYEEGSAQQLVTNQLQLRYTLLLDLLALPLSHYTCSGLVVKPIYLAKVYTAVATG